MTHVVFFRFETPEQSQQAARLLRALDGVVPTLQSIEVGVDEMRSDRSWDVCLITRFANTEAMEAYQVHPAHQEVLTWVRANVKSVAAVDWT